jgi:hypothetical protein
MPFNDALFWFGLTGFGTGLYFLFERNVKWRHSIGVTLIGLLACVYAEYRYYHPAIPAIPLWVILLVLTWALLGYAVYLGRFRRLSPPPAEKPREPSKLVIHSANYRAWQGDGPTYDVTEFLQKIISGDSLVFDVENHNFVVGNQNFVRNDPLPGKAKRLRVSYSYGGQLTRTVERSEHGRLVLPEDSEILRLNNEIEQMKRELETQKAKASSELSRTSAIKLDPVQIGRAGGLMTRAGEAECLAQELEKIWFLYNREGKEVLVRPFGAKELPDQITEHRHKELFRLRTLCKWHMDSVKELDGGFRSTLLDHGFPNNDEYLDVKRNLEDHAKLLRELAGTLASQDARATLYTEKHRLEDELEEFELPKPSLSLKDLPMAPMSAAIRDAVLLRPMTNQERYESEKKDRRIKRIRELLKIIDEKLGDMPKGA